MYHQPQHKMYRVMGFRFSEIEIRDLAKGWGIISLAFGIVLTGTSNLASTIFLINIALSGFTVGTAFILHELGHKFVAQRYGYVAEFRSFDQMLLFALLMSFFGFVQVWRNNGIFDLFHGTRRERSECLVVPR